MSVGRICQREVDLADLDESVQATAERMHQHTKRLAPLLRCESQSTQQSSAGKSEWML